MVNLLWIPCLLGVGALWVEHEVKNSYRQIATQTLHQQTLDRYIDSLSTLLLERHFSQPPISETVMTERISPDSKLEPRLEPRLEPELEPVPKSQPRDPQTTAANPLATPAPTPTFDAETVAITRVKTLSVLRGLDGERRGALVHFLYDSCFLRDQSHNPLPHCHDLPVMTLAGADLRQMTLQAAWLPDLLLPGTYLKGANLNGSSLIRANLSGADLSPAPLAPDPDPSLFERLMGWQRAWRGQPASAAQTLATSLQGVDLSYANLSGADLRGVDLQNANLQQANLTDAKFDAGTNLAGANLRSAIGLTLEQIKMAQNWQQAEYSLAQEGTGGWAIVSPAVSDRRP